MALRATNQLVEVLGPGNGGKLRVTSQYIEVLAPPEAILLVDAENELAFTTAAKIPNSLYVSQTIAFTTSATTPNKVLLAEENELVFSTVAAYTGPKWLDVASTIEFTSEPRFPLLYEETVTSSIAFTQAIGLGGDRNLTASNILAMSVFADLHEKIRSITNEIDFTSAATGDIYKLVGNILDLSQALEKGITVASFLQPITLVQTVRVNPIKQSVTQTIAFTQLPYNSVKCLAVDSELELDTLEVVIRPWMVSAATEVQWYETGIDPVTYLEISILTGLQDSVTVEKIIGRSAVSPVWTSQTAKKAHIKVGAIDVNADSNVAFSTIIPTPIYAEATSTLSFTTYADSKYEFPVTELELESEVTLNKILNLSVSSELEFVSSFFAVTEGFSLCEYSPFVGSTTDPEAPQRLLKNVPVLDANASGVTLFYPWSVPTTTVHLRGPDLGNKNRLEFQRIKRETRGGTLIVWADPIWPKNERLVLSFSGLTETEGQSLLDFIYLTLGREVGLIDWEGNWWRVVTMTPSEALIRNGRENLSINLEFEMTRSVLRGRGINEITFIDTITKTLIRFRDETSTIDFIQTTERQATFNLTAENELEFTQVAGQQIVYNRISGNELEFTQTLYQQTIWNRTPANELEFTTVVERLAVFACYLTSEIECIEDSISSIKCLDADNEIEYIEEVVSSIKSLDADSELEPINTLIYELI
jgi:hypothetical protein